MTPRDRWAIFIHEVNYSLRTCKMRFLYRVSPDDFQRNSLRNIPMNSKRDGNIGWRKNERFDQVARFEPSFPRFEEACILIRVPTSICQGLAINLAIVGDCLLRNSPPTNAAMILYLVYIVYILGKRYSARYSVEFSPIVITFIIKLYPFFCRSPCRQISNFLSCYITRRASQKSVSFRAATRNLQRWVSLELKFCWILRNKLSSIYSLATRAYVVYRCLVIFANSTQRRLYLFRSILSVAGLRFRDYILAQFILFSTWNGVRSDSGGRRA